MWTQAGGRVAAAVLLVLAFSIAQTWVNGVPRVAAGGPNANLKTTLISPTDFDTLDAVSFGTKSACVAAGLKGNICGTAIDSSTTLPAAGVELIIETSGIPAHYWNGTDFSTTTSTYVNTTVSQTTGQWSYSLPMPTAGSYYVQAQALDSLGNYDPNGTAASFTLTGPTVTINNLGGIVGDPTPIFSGTGQLDSNVSSTITVNVYAGPYASGPPYETLTTQLDSKGNFSVQASPPLTTGAYTVTASQSDLAGNVGTSSGSTFTVDTSMPLFVPQLSHTFTNRGTAANPLTVTGTATPNSPVYLDTGLNCTGASLGSTTADASGRWSIGNITSLSDGTQDVSAYSVVGSTPSNCDSATFTVDTVMPSSQITFPTVSSDSSAAAWSAGCTPVGICGSASDIDSGVAAVLVTIRSTSGPSNGLYWDPSTQSFDSTTGAWYTANVSQLPSGGWVWNYPMARPPDGTYVAMSAAIDNGGNPETALGGTVGCSTAGGGGLIYTSGGGLIYTGGGGLIYTGGGGCPGSGTVVDAGGGSLIYTSGGGLIYTGGGSGGGSGCAGGGSLIYTSGGGLAYIPGGGGLIYTSGGLGACNAMAFAVNTQPPAASILVDGQSADKSLNINPLAPVDITFSAEAINPATVNGSTITLSPNPTGASPVCGTSAAPDPLCLNVTINGLAPATFYTLTISSGVLDAAGNGALPKTFHFSTAVAAPPSSALDSDGDGIPDQWDGAVVHLSGGPTLNTGSWGFQPTRKDLCVVEDYMVGEAADSSGATHTYDQHVSHAANQAIVDAFAGHGIHLVIFEGPSYSAGLPGGYSGPWYGGPIPMTNPLGVLGGRGFEWGTAYPGTSQSFDSIRNASFVPTGLAQFCHFAVIAHTLGNTASSGSSRGIDASDLVIALGAEPDGVGNVQEQAGTLMHEIGHNLGLHHGGSVPAGASLPASIDANYNPNYLSVMNYAFQFTGVLRTSASSGNACTIAGATLGCMLDYSEGTLSDLNESSLYELSGLGSGAAAYGMAHLCGSAQVVVPDATAPIDWNCDGTIGATPESVDVNGDGVTGTITASNDWANLNFLVGTIGLGRNGTGSQGPEPDTSLIDVDPSEPGGVDSVAGVEGRPVLVQPSVRLSNLVQVYTGGPRAVTVITIPGSLNGITATYSGISGTSYGPSTTPPSGTGTYRVDVSVADPRFAPIKLSGSLLVYAAPTSAGGFVLGDRTAASALMSGSTVTFWGSNWASLNSLSGGSASDSFKGYANSLNSLSAGATWSSRPGNSSSPPATLPSYLGVLVTGNTTQAGGAVSGTVSHLVVVHTNPGYAPDPGHPGTGTVVMQIW